MGAPTRPKPAVYLEPNDLSTNVMAGSIALWLDDSAGLVTRAQLEELAAKVGVSAWPDDAAVAITTTVIEQVPVRGGAEIQVLPTSPLAEGWYVLQVDELDGSVAGFRLRGGTLAEDGSATARFRIGNQPTVVNVRVCDAAGTERKLIVGLSEQVRILQPLEEHVEITTGRGPAQCRSTISDIEHYETLNFACLDIRDDDTVALKLSAAFATLASPDQPVVGSTVEYRFEMAKLVAAETGCLQYRPQ